MDLEREWALTCCREYTNISRVHVGLVPFTEGCCFLAFLRYNDAMATIRRVSSVEHHFQLVITRVYEDGDQELLEDEDESTPILRFHLV